MGKLIPILGIVAILATFYYFISTDSNFEASVKQDYTEARRLVNEFGNSGEEIVFYLDPKPPITEFTYVEKEVEKIVFNNATGETETVTVKEIEKVPTSEVSVYSKDRQTGNLKVCKRGHQCDITGEITLIDPVTGLAIDPPYGFLMIIECETSHDPYIQSCQSFSPRVVNDLTFGDKSFKYTFTTDSRKDPLGFYTAQISVTSKFKFTDPTTGLQRPEVRDGVLRVEVVE